MTLRRPSPAAGRPDPTDWPRPLALVLSGGGSYGASQVGMIQALEERSIRPDLIVGTSVGALNGAMVAGRPGEASPVLADAWSRISLAALVGRNPARFALRLTRRRTSLVSARPLRELVTRWLPVERFDQLTIPLTVVATDAEAGEPALLNRGELLPALVASAAIPGVFPPVEIDGQLYIDGGVTANVPVRQAIALGARTVIVLNANPPRLTGRVPSTMLGSLLHASSVMLRSQRAEAVDDFSATHRIIPLPQVTPTRLSSFDFGHSRALIESAHRHTADALDALTSGTSPR